MSTFSSIADTPSYMATQYTPLVSTFRKHSQELPDRHCPEPNSEGEDVVTHGVCALVCANVGGMNQQCCMQEIFWGNVLGRDNIAYGCTFSAWFFYY